MKKNKDGSLIFDKEELLGDKCKITANVFPLDEHQFYVLLKNGDTYVENLAGKVFYIALGVFMQLIVVFVFVYYYHFSHNDEMVHSALSQIDKFQIGLLIICLVVSGCLKVAGLFVESERKQLVSKIKAQFKK